MPAEKAVAPPPPAAEQGADPPASVLQLLPVGSVYSGLVSFTSFTTFTHLTSPCAALLGGTQRTL